MTTKTSNNIKLKIQNEKGLHARAAAAFVKTVEKFDAEVFVQKDNQQVCGNSIMGLMMLCASQNSEIDVSSSGKQAKIVLNALEKLINDKFNED